MRNTIFTVIIATLTLLFSTACARVEERDIMFYYFESCPSCEEYQLAEQYKEKIEELDGKRQWKGLSRNLISPEAARELKAVLKEKELPDVSRSLPLLIVGNEYLNGYKAIGEKLDELQGSAGN